MIRAALDSCLFGDRVIVTRVLDGDSCTAQFKLGRPSAGTRIMRNCLPEGSNLAALCISNHQVRLYLKLL